MILLSIPGGAIRSETTQADGIPTLQNEILLLNIRLIFFVFLIQRKYLCQTGIAYIF